jgi:hypothetical protein
MARKIMHPCFRHRFQVVTKCLGTSFLEAAESVDLGTTVMKSHRKKD